MTKPFHIALVEALDASGWSIPEMCKRAGVSKDQMTKFVQRAKNGDAPSTNVDDALKLANAFGVTLDEMMQDNTAALRSEAALLWRALDQGERDILLAAARGRHAMPDQDPTQSAEEP